jgi:hypothetical protein
MAMINPPQRGFYNGTVLSCHPVGRHQTSVTRCDGCIEKVLVPHCLISMDWFKGKSTGNHRFSH